jgi:hypothetical protein
MELNILSVKSACDAEPNCQRIPASPLGIAIEAFNRMFGFYRTLQGWPSRHVFLFFFGKGEYSVETAAKITFRGNRHQAGASGTGARGYADKDPSGSISFARMNPRVRLEPPPHAWEVSSVVARNVR